MTHIQHPLKIEPMGRPHMQCTQCGMTVVWPDGLAKEEKAAFASLVRRDSVAGMRFAEAQFGFGPRESKVLVLHLTSVPGVCHKCKKPVVAGESCCSCRSVNLDW
jgi:hypothetical protein